MTCVRAGSVPVICIRRKNNLANGSAHTLAQGTAGFCVLPHSDCTEQPNRLLRRSAGRAQGERRESAAQRALRAA